MTRPDGRAPDQLRPVSFERDFTEMTSGSVLVSFGRTRVLCTVSFEEDIPRWLRGRGSGWVTAEYNMLPGSSPERVRRSVDERPQPGDPAAHRSGPAQRVRLVALGERSITVDCDVLQADGGTRTASICGGYLALHDALSRLVGGAVAGCPRALARGVGRHHRRHASTCPTPRTPGPRSTSTWS